MLKVWMVAQQVLRVIQVIQETKVKLEIRVLRVQWVQQVQMVIQDHLLVILVLQESKELKVILVPQESKELRVPQENKDFRETRVLRVTPV